MSKQYHSFPMDNMYMTHFCIRSCHYNYSLDSSLHKLRQQLKHILYLSIHIGIYHSIAKIKLQCLFLKLNSLTLYIHSYYHSYSHVYTMDNFCKYKNRCKNLSLNFLASKWNKPKPVMQDTKHSRNRISIFILILENLKLL